MFDTISSSRKAQRAQIEAEVKKWLKAGNKITQVPIGVSGITGSVFASYAKAQANGLKKIKTEKKVENILDEDL